MIKQSANFIKDETKLINDYMDLIFDIPLGKTGYKKSSIFGSIELIIDPQCSQSCDYCYISNFGKELYPKEIRASKEDTLKNIDKLLHYYCEEKKFFFPDYEIFSGDIIFFDNYFFEILDIMYKYLSKIYNKLPELYLDREVKYENKIRKYGILIIVPFNSCFIDNENYCEKIYDYKEKFFDIGVNLAFSWSHDGYYAVQSREKRTLTDDFYKKAFSFIDKTESGIHPMLSAENIDTAIENYEWWKEASKKYLPDRFKRGDIIPMTLEVRNNNWTDDKLEKFCEYLEYRYNDTFNALDKDTDKMAKLFFCGDRNGIEEKAFISDEYDVLKLTIMDLDQQKTSSCAIGNQIMWRTSDLALVPCHRTCYPQFIGGFLRCEEDNYYIEPYNVSGYIAIKHSNWKMMPVCVTCWAKDYCIKGCLGSQFETSGEIFLPNRPTCKLEKIKISCLLKLLIETNVLQTAIQKGYLDEYKSQTLINIAEGLGYKIENE